MTKIIFLDIDGVLNLKRRQRDRFGSLFHSAFVKNLKNIIKETDAKIVIISTWRFSGLQIMQEMWKHRNMPGELIGITPFNAVYNADSNSPFSERCERGCEIRDWLLKNPVDSYVILDDDNDMLPDQQDHFIRCSNNFDQRGNIEGYGITKQCAEKAIKILNKK